MRQPGRRRRWLWGLAALPVILLLAALGYFAWSLYDPVTRMPPAEALPLTLDPADRQALRNLYSPDPGNRAEAACLAGKLGRKDPERAARLVPFMIGLLGDCDSPGRPRLAFSLAYLRSLWNPPRPVMFEFARDTPWRPDTMAASALVSMGKPAVEPLIRVLGESKRNVARYNAAHALGSIDDPRALAAALAALRDPAWEVRFGAIDGIQSSLWNGTETLEAVRVEVIAAILVAARDEAAGVRLVAVWGLTYEDSPDARGSLLALLHDREPTVREAAVRAMWYQGAWGGEQLVTALHDPNITVRQSAARLLKHPQSPATMETLRKAVKDDDPFVRETAAKALERIGIPK